MSDRAWFRERYARGLEVLQKLASETPSPTLGRASNFSFEGARLTRDPTCPTTSDAGAGSGDPDQAPDPGSPTEIWGVYEDLYGTEAEQSDCDFAAATSPREEDRPFADPQSATLSPEPPRDLRAAEGLLLTVGARRLAPKSIDTLCPTGLSWFARTFCTGKTREDLEELQNDIRELTLAKLQAGEPLREVRRYARRTGRRTKWRVFCGGLWNYLLAQLPRNLASRIAWWLTTMGVGLGLK